MRNFSTTNILYLSGRRQADPLYLYGHLTFQHGRQYRSNLHLGQSYMEHRDSLYRLRFCRVPLPAVLRPSQRKRRHTPQPYRKAHLQTGRAMGPHSRFFNDRRYRAVLCYPALQTTAIKKIAMAAKQPLSPTADAPSRSTKHPLPGPLCRCCIP